MFCPNCGKQLNENGICVTCSNPTSGKMVRVVFNRAKSFFGCAVSYKIFVDGMEVAKLKNGGSAEVSLPAGAHNIAFDMWSASNTQQVIIPDNCSTFIIDTKLKMGLLKNNIAIVSTRCE